MRKKSMTNPITDGVAVLMLLLFSLFRAYYEVSHTHTSALQSTHRHTHAVRVHT